ncbi:MAG TPA: hypothetical protein VGH38_16305 [Bryobacteraceae bacterium]|jgi:hypothetical protein
MLRWKSATLAALLAIPAFAQQADPAPNPASGVLVSRPPATFYQAMRPIFRSAPLPKEQPAAVASDVCAIRLTEVPVRGDIDNGIFLPHGVTRLTERAMVISPPAPACPAEPAIR